MSAASSTSFKEFYEAWYLTPFSHEFLVEFAKAAVQEEQLGRHENTDLLCLGFAQIDSIGHYAGPDSHEMMDSMLRLDRELAELFKFLDRQIGLEHCVVVLSADHGCAPLPERVQASDRPGIGAKRVDAAKLDAAVLEALNTAFGMPPEGKPRFLRDNDGYRLNREVLAAQEASIEDASRVVRDALAGLDEIEVPSRDRRSSASFRSRKPGSCRWCATVSRRRSVKMFCLSSGPT
ncbi:MAG: alkaline phosphatase family protein [Opitutaceae bacterium]